MPKKKLKPEHRKQPTTKPNTLHKKHTTQKTAVSEPMLLQQKETLSPQQQAQILQRTFGNQAMRRLAIQRKMKVGPVGDKYEQEADAVAKQVVNNLDMSPVQAGDNATAQRQEEEELQMKPAPAISPIQRQGEEEEDLQAKSLMQRQEDEEEIQAKGDPMVAGGEVSSGIESTIQNAKSSGKPMSNDVRAPMESAFNTNFSGVKIHTDSQSHLLNEKLQAKAFTSGQDVFFRQGEYNPNQSSGKELLAHELTHVVQQTGGIQRKTADLTTPQYSAGFKFGKKGSSYKQIKKAVASYNGMAGDNFEGWAKHLNQLSTLNALIAKWILSYNGRKKKKKNDANKKLELDTLKNSVDAEVIAVQTQVHNELVLIQSNNYGGAESFQKLQAASSALNGLLPDVRVGLSGWIDAIPGLITTAEGRMENVSGKFVDDNVTEDKDEAVGGGLNKLDYIKYDFGLHQTGANEDKVVPGGAFEGYFQADVDEDADFGHHRGRYTGMPKDNPEFSKRSRAVYELSKLLDPSLIPPTFAAQHKGKMGSIMQKVDGQTGHELRDNARGGDIMELMNTQRTLADPTFRRSLSNLYLFDVIAGQVDRHGGNYIVVMEGGVIKGVKGIDNDMAFGKDYDFDKFNDENADMKSRGEFSYVAGKMPSELNEIDLAFSRKIIDLAQNKQGDVRAALVGLIKDTELQATLVRLVKLANFLQQLINTNNGAIKATWN